MAWDLLAIPGVGTIATIAGWATKVVNNFRYLKGIDGVVTTQSGLIIDNSLGTEYVKLPLLSTAEAATALVAEGQVAHDEATHRIKIHDGTAVRSIVSTVDVDDTPVNGASTDPISSNWAFDFINILSAQGDLPYATGAGTWDRLAKGTAGQVLVMNGGATAPIWAATQARIKAGEYTGDATGNRAIAHSLGVVPKFVFIAPLAYQALLYIVAATAVIQSVGVGTYAVTAADTTNFYVGLTPYTLDSGNYNTQVYNWIAIV